MDRAPPRRPAGPRSTIRAAAGTESENLRRAMAASRRTARAWELEHGDITRALKASSEAERLKAQEEDSLNCALALSLQSAAATPSEKQAAWDRVLELSMETARWKREEEALAKALELSVRSAREEERLRGAEAGAQSRCCRWGEAAMRLHPRARSPHWTGFVSGPGIGNGPGALLQSAHTERTSSGKGTTLDRDSERWPSGTITGTRIGPWPGPWSSRYGARVRSGGCVRRGTRGGRWRRPPRPGLRRSPGLGSRRPPLRQGPSLTRWRRTPRRRPPPAEHRSLRRTGSATGGSAMGRPRSLQSPPWRPRASRPTKAAGSSWR